MNNRFTIKHEPNCHPEYLILDSQKEDGLGICGCGIKADAEFVLAALSSQWVSVDDKPLPEKDGDYLCKVDCAGHLSYELYTFRTMWRTFCAYQIIAYQAEPLPPIEQEPSK